jgi:hypothetical protein
VSERPVVPKEELEAAIEARRELGTELEPQVVDAFVERIERRIDERVASRVGPRGRRDDRDERSASIGVALGSMGIGIPLTGIAAGTAGLAGLLVCWIGIVLVNVAYALSRRYARR